MTQALSGAAIAAVVAVCWLLGRPRRTILRSTDTAGVAAINRLQMERLLTNPMVGSSTPTPQWLQGTHAAAAAATEAGQAHGGMAPAPAIAFLRPAQAHERAQRLRQLERQFSAGGALRRQAIAICAGWKDRDALPLIRRGLRDPDPEVMALAAAAMAGFRGRSAGPAAQRSPQPAGRIPRNVSRTR